MTTALVTYTAIWSYNFRAAAAAFWHSSSYIFSSFLDMWIFLSQSFGCLHCKKRLAIFSSPAWISLTKLCREWLYYSPPGKVCLVTFRLGTGKSLFFFTVYLIFSLLNSDILSYALFNFKFRYFSPTLIEEEEEWIDAKDFKHILDLRHKIRSFLLKNSIRSFDVENATPISQRCDLFLSKVRSFPFQDGAFPIKGASFQFQKWGCPRSKMGPVHDSNVNDTKTEVQTFRYRS